MNQGYPRLLGDIGGTNARWAWQAGPGAALEHISVLPCTASGSLYESALSYLEQKGGTRPTHAAIGIATALDGDAVRMTNSPWAFSIAQFKQALGLERCLVINDFTALAMSLPVLGAGDATAVGGGAALASAPIGLIGPGTGLGVSGLVPGRDGHWTALSGEGGHVTLAASDALEGALLERLRARFGHVSAERVLSGDGLVNLYRALCELQGHAARDLGPAALTEAALQHSDPLCRQTVGLFASFLGNVAGNLALTLGARGGIYVGGGIVPRLGSAFDAQAFRRRFEDKGRFADYLRAIPTWVITASTPALLGASLALDQLPA